jgi:integrase/recombinase XerD
MAGATSRISRVLVTGPLAPFAEAYRRELRERGYTARSAVSQLRQVARFSRWLEAGQVSVWELGAGWVEEFLDWQRAVGRHRSQWSRPGLVCLLEVLRELGGRRLASRCGRTPRRRCCWPGSGATLRLSVALRQEPSRIM